MSHLRKNSGESAFTLFELIVVCALISVMLVVAVPPLRNNLLTDPLKASSRQVVGFVKGLREKAIREQQAYLIYFDISGNSIWAEKDHEIVLLDSEKANEDGVRLPEPVRILDVWTTGEGKLESGRPVLWVTKQGYMDQTVIHLGTDGGEVMSLLVSPFLGTVRIADSYVDLD